MELTPILLEDLGMQYATEKSKQKTRFGLYKCGYCGEEFKAFTAHIKSGHTSSCGCMGHKNMHLTTHGLHHNRFYTTWSSMVNRCAKSTSDNYKNYGGRGIKVCEEWPDIRNFIEWAESTHPNIEGLSLDRIDNDGNYEPDNCRWSDATIQSINQRIRSDNKSEYVGVFWREDRRKWVARISINKIQTFIGNFNKLEEAVVARDNYIIENNLPHKLSKDYIKKENK